MKRTHLALLMGALCLALATTTVAVAAQPSPPSIEDQNDRLLRHLEAEQATGHQAAVELARSMERDDAPVSIARGAQPEAPIAAAVPRGRIDVVATVVLGLVGGLVGGVVAMAGWTAASRRRLRRAPSAA